MKAPFRIRPRLSLINRLKVAANETEISFLLALSQDFKDASDATKYKWQRCAEKRREELGRKAVAK